MTQEFAIIRRGTIMHPEQKIVEIFTGSEEDAWSRAFVIREEINDGSEYAVSEHPEPVPGYADIFGQSDK